MKDIQNVLMKAKGIELTDSEDRNKYITPVDVAGKDKVYVSRIRQSPYSNKEFSLWVVADNIRKGAALNAVQIAEILSKKFL